MDAIALKIIDPAGLPWAQLVDPTHAVGDAVRVMARRMSLPGELRFALWPEGALAPLADTETFRAHGVPPGATLLLKAVRDAVFAAYARRLYDEASRQARRQAWDEVRESLETLYAVDPDYPDPLMLRTKASIQPRYSAPKEVPAEEPAPAAGPRTSVPPAGGQPPPDEPPPPPSPPRPRRGIGSVFVWLFFLVAGAAVAGAVLVYFRVIPAPDWLPEWFPRQAIATTVVNGVEVGTGDIRVTLTWATSADLDLHVVDPSGEELYYGARQAASGSRLDVDANAGCAGDRQVENIFWPAGEAPRGTYRVSVNYFAACGAGATPYEVTAYVNDALVYRRTGVLLSQGSTVSLPAITR